MIYFMAVFMPITVIGSFLLISTSNLLANYHRDLLKSDNVRMKTTLFEITTQIYNISEELAFDESIQDVISGAYSSRSDMAGRVSEVGIIDNYEYNYAEIENIEIYTDNPELMDYKQFHRADEEIREAEWFQRAASQSSVFWIPMMSTDKYGNEYWNLCLVRRIPLIDSRFNGVLVIKISDNYLKTRINSQEYKTMVSVDEGPVFSARTGRLMGNGRRWRSTMMRATINMREIWNRRTAPALWRFPHSTFTSRNPESISALRMIRLTTISGESFSSALRL